MDRLFKGTMKFEKQNARDISCLFKNSVKYNMVEQSNATVLVGE